MSTLCLAAPARADRSDFGAGLTSDYVWRGFSKTRGRATWMADARYTWDRGSFVATSLTDQRSDAATGHWEWLTTLGQTWVLDADQTLTGSLTRYNHLGGRRRLEGDYVDLALAWDWRGRASALFAASPDNRLGSRSGWTATLELAWHQPLVAAWAVDIGAGWYERQGIGRPGYGYGSIGIAYRNGPLSVVIARIASDAVRRGGMPANAQPSRAVASVVWLH